MLISQGQLLYLLGFSFLYGLLHSVAPGHGKTAVTSMSLIHGYRRRQALVLVAIIAALQAASACILFVITAKIAEQFAFSLSDNVRLLTQGCAVFIILLALKEFASVVKRRLKQTPSPEDDDSADSNGNISWKALLLIGFRPCTGAVLVLFLSNMLGSLMWGMIATFVMALGTAMTNSILVFNALTIQRQMKNHSVKPNANLSDTLNLVLAVTMVASGFILYNFASVAGLQNFVR
ncbi:nickel/cobalt transporter [Vibrio alginolyticus]|uniref:nickel/cobalt transporter n=1 Tax=Vibrio alginolyticus TaxID=663 RepID=UPI00215C351A|nr:nickel transporter [Vibrio alginolyticus]MCR9311051.1 nickel transporter [Vibrio alginolyticus]MCR9319657.1 nickel transporter [Vibrio alginolyticus]MCR9401621.1 nickel transporter [Vibrio alginolyticus]MCR9465518.1 nickel transporter [Vibrio alginolyticus]MCR9481128.1 nickel transporter [Vibrio alginolyticus]